MIDRTERPFVGLSSLAIGADQLFAKVVLERGGQLVAIVPFAGYRQCFSPEDVHQYDALLARATDVETLVGRGSDQESYLAAGMRVVQRSDAMIAVWDGQPAAGVGGTADIVQYARAVGRPLSIVDPIRRIVS
jgi:hypothetical protein